MVFNADLYIQRLLHHFNVATLLALADKMKTTQAVISNWKKRNAIKPIEKKCKELGIYEVIFNIEREEIEIDEAGKEHVVKSFPSYLPDYERAKILKELELEQEHMKHEEDRNIGEEIKGITELNTAEQETNVSLDDLDALLKSKFADEIAGIADIATLSIFKDKLLSAQKNNKMSEFMTYLLQYKI